MSALPVIPVIEGTPEELLRQRQEDALLLLEEGRRQYGSVALAGADPVARWWLRRNGNPLLGELDRMAEVLGRPGMHMLNLSYEWGCTTAAVPDPEGHGVRLLRTLDWPFRHLGARLVVLRQTGPAGPFLNVTWPGFVGVLTAMAPGRFTVALNQAKMLHGRLTRLLEWPLAKVGFLGRRALPPAHLLRQVCDTAPDFATAMRLLAETPVCSPVFFILAGTKPGEHCVVERLPDRAYLRGEAAVCANHWRFPGVLGDRPGGLVRFDEKSAYIQVSLARYAALSRTTAAQELDWVVPPVLVRDTKLGFAANAATGDFVLQGYEGGAPATQLLKLGP